MKIDEQRELHAYNIIKGCYVKGDDFMLFFRNSGYKISSVKKASNELLLKEYVYRNNSRTEYPSVNNILLEIIGDELNCRYFNVSYKRKEIINKIKKNILKKQNIFLYLYGRIKQLLKYDKRK